MYLQVHSGRVFVGRMRKGDDLLQALNDFCARLDLPLAVFQLIGAVQTVQFCGYDQERRGYSEPIHLIGSYEVVSCTGTVSIKDYRPQAHAHIMVADKHGRVLGGHLLLGTIVYNIEFSIQELLGGVLERRHDREFDAPLWFADSPPSTDE